MKYNLLKLKDVFLKKILKYLIIEMLLIIVFVHINSYADECQIIYFGLYKFTFYDQIKDLIKIIDTAFIIFSSLNYYLYDLNRSPEYIILRKTNSRYLLDKIIVTFIFNAVIKIITLLIICVIFNKITIINFPIIINGIINLAFVVLVTISFVNFYSNNRFLLFIIVFGVFFYNLVLLISNPFIKLIIIILLLFTNYKCYSTQKVYNKIIR